MSDHEAAATAAQGLMRPDGITVSSLAECARAEFLPYWHALENTASEPNPFYASWALPAALRAFDPRSRVMLLEFWQAGQLRGLVPLEKSGDYYGYPIPHLRVWLHDNCFCAAPLVNCGFEKAFWQALLDWTSGQAASPMFLHLAHMPEAGALFDALRTVLAERGDIAAIVHREERALLKSDQSAEAYFAASMNGKKRKELRRQYNRLSEIGPLTFLRHTGTRDLTHWTDSFLALEAAGWKGAEGSALACDIRTETLFRETLKGAGQAGQLERLALYLDGKPIAMLVNFLIPPGAFSFKTAFDEDFARYSPGVLLQRENLDILEHDCIAWTDSCAAADHPMIERIWREKRSMLRLSIGIGGKLRQAAFRQLLRAESSSEILGQR